MFKDPIRTTPFVLDTADVGLRLRVNRADTALLLVAPIRLPHLRVM